MFKDGQYYKIVNHPFKFRKILDLSYKWMELDRHVETIKKLIGWNIEFAPDNNLWAKLNPPKPEGVPSYEEAVMSLEKDGIFNPSTPDILERMGFDVMDVVGWFEGTKGVERSTNYQETIFRKEHAKNVPKYRECFMNREFWCISSSQKRAIFTDGKLYIVDSPFYGHALYVFRNPQPAFKWAENKTTSEEAKKDCLARITHHIGWREKVQKLLSSY